MSKVAVGQRYGRLSVVGLLPDRKNPKAECICDCGTVAFPQRGALINGRAQSCGCLRREKLAAHVESIKQSPEAIARRKAAGHAAWVKANPKRWREINTAATRRHYKKNPEAAKRNCQIRRARLKNALGHVTPGIEKYLLDQQKGRCACCKEKITGRHHLDHKVPLSRGGLHEDGNLEILCETCNLSKGARPPIAFMQARGFLL